MTLSKRAKIIIIAVAAAVVIATVTVLLVLLLPKKDNAPTPAFAFAEYTVGNGDRVTASGADSYRIVGGAPTGVSVTPDGVFVVGDGATDGAQVLLGAVKGGKVVSTAVCTISVISAPPVIVFDNLSLYVIDGERVSATATPARSITYSLKSEVDGVKIDRVTGTVSFSSTVEDGTEFTVTATANGVGAEKSFKASIGTHVTTPQNVAICEYKVGGAAQFALDFGGDEETADKGVLGVSVRNSLLSASEWSYDTATRTVSVKNTTLSKLLMGENAVSIFTARNTVTCVIKCARYVKDAFDLAAINKSARALSEYYVMVDDVDLTDYLAASDAGWMPIGIYREVEDGTATAMAFNGTFDGNGHTISGFWANRNDDYAYNGGLFGYVTANAQIMNVRLVGSETRNYVVKSFSGTLVGSNCGIIKNCAVDVDIEQAYGSRMAGAFVGRNEGTISDCYSLGLIADGDAHGAFCGDNSLGALIRCYAVNGGDIPMVGSVSAKLEDCKKFSTEQELIDGAEFSESSGWITSDGLPQLPVIHVDYELSDIVINNTETELEVGQTLQLDITGAPANLFSYDKLTFCVIQGDGVIITSSGLVITEYATAGVVRIEVRNGDIARAYSFMLVQSGGEA
ncbi:MAG: hypothetical protein J1G04_00870 [Clostridiales bacterium]|nr:hypothetical protein [Clostridiales bacterium]